jgi:hypothetical protein
MILPIVSLVCYVRFKSLYQIASSVQHQKQVFRLYHFFFFLTRVDVFASSCETYLIEPLAPPGCPLVAGDVDGNLVNLKVDKGPLPLRDASHGVVLESVDAALVPGIGPGVPRGELVEKDVDVKGRKAARGVYCFFYQNKLKIRFGCLVDFKDARVIPELLTADNGLDELRLLARVREDDIRMQNVPDGHCRIF